MLCDAPLMGDSDELGLVVGGYGSHTSDDTALTRQALQSVGFDVHLHAWDSGELDALPALIHTPWDYTNRLDAFLDFVESRTHGPPTLNDCHTLQIYAMKNYILDLTEEGVPIPPTTTSISLCESDIEKVGGFPVVVKPIAGAGGRETHLLMEASDALHLGGTRKWLVQRYQPEITLGEFSTVFIGGRVSHHVLKRPARGEFRVQAAHGGSYESISDAPFKDLLSGSVADRTASCTYARLDYIDTDGGPLLMELEVVEPELFLRFSPGSEMALAREVRDRISD